MKIATLIARILLGLMFTVFGLNGFFHFMPMQLPPGDAGALFTIMFKYGWCAARSVSHHTCFTPAA